MNFEEFRAAQLRKRAGSVNTSRQNKPVTPAAGGSDQNVKNSKGIYNTSLDSGGSVGSLVERSELQVFIVVLLVADSYLAFAHVILNSIKMELAYISLAKRLLDGFSIACNGIFILELLVLLVTFRFKFLYHVGYLTDVVIVGIQVISSTRSNSSASKLLNLFRYFVIGVC
jgi:hypothetical protein